MVFLCRAVPSFQEEEMRRLRGAGIGLVAQELMRPLPASPFPGSGVFVIFVSFVFPVAPVLPV